MGSWSDTDQVDTNQHLFGLNRKRCRGNICLDKEMHVKWTCLPPGAEFRVYHVSVVTGNNSFYMTIAF